MNKSPKLKPTKYDAIVAAAILLVAAALGARYWALSDAPSRSGGLTVVVSIDGAEVERARLLDYSRGVHVYENNGFTVTVDAYDGVVDVTDSTCPNQDCRRTPPIRRAGQSIVCLPARVVVALESASGTADYDAIAG